jgi:hypothetical protein
VGPTRQGLLQPLTERERLRGREPVASRPRASSNPGRGRAAPAAGSPSRGLQWPADRERAPILVAGGLCRPRDPPVACQLRRSRAPAASRLRVSSNHGRRRAPPTPGSPSRGPAPPASGSNGQPAAGKLQSRPRAGSIGCGIPQLRASSTGRGLPQPRVNSGCECRGPAPAPVAGLWIFTRRRSVGWGAWRVREDGAAASARRPVR